MKRMLTFICCFLALLAGACAELPVFNGEAYQELTDLQLPEAYYGFREDAKAEVHYDPLDSLGRAELPMRLSLRRSSRASAGTMWLT